MARYSLPAALVPAGQRLHEPLVEPAEVELLDELRRPPPGRLPADAVSLTLVEQRFLLAKSRARPLASMIAMSASLLLAYCCSTATAGVR